MTNFGEHKAGPFVSLCVHKNSVLINFLMQSHNWEVKEPNKNSETSSHILQQSLWGSLKEGREILDMLPQ